MVMKMMMKENDNLVFTVDYNKLLEAGIKIEHFLFLKILNEDKDKSKLLSLYHEQFNTLVRPSDIDFLFDKGLLTLLKQDRDPSGKNYFVGYTLNNMYTTKLYNDLFEKRISDKSIEELKDTYPTKTPAKKRRLQTDPVKWKSTYLKIIKGKPELHETIINCIKAEAKHRRATNSEEFWPMLTTYLNNRRWEDYEDEITENFSDEEVSKDYDI